MRTIKSLCRHAIAAGVLMLATLPAARADFEQAMTLFKANKYAEAAGEFKALVEQAPDYADGHFMLGICYLKTSNLDGAEGALTKAIELNPDKFEYHFNLANVYLKNRKWNKVVSSLDKAEKLAANEQYKQAIYKTRGSAQVQAGNWDDAIADLERAPKDARTLTTLGKAYFKQGDYDAAVRTLGQAAAKDGSDAEIRELRAEALLNLAAKASGTSAKKAKYAEALTAANDFAKVAPNGFKSHYLVGRAALGAQDYGKAASSFTSALEKEPGNCNAMVNQGKALMALERWRDAYASFDNATKCSPRMAQAWENKGYTLQKQEKLEDAIAAYREALKFNSASSFAKENIATCQENLKIRDFNAKADEEEAENLAEIEKEKRRVAEEERKREEWKKKQEEDD